MAICEYKYHIGWNLSNSFLKNSEKQPLQMQIYYRGKQFRFGVKIFLTKKEYLEITSGKVLRNSALKDVRDHMRDLEAKANSILDNMPVINPTDFKVLFSGEVNINTPKSTRDLKTLFENLIALYKKEKKSTQTYVDSSRSFMKFTGEWTMLESTDPTWIRDYKVWMIESGRSAATANLYLRCLRVLWNHQIKNKKIHAKHYPFSEITLGAPRKTKKALMPEDVQKLWKYEPCGEGEQRAKDYWFFCYLSNGMNPSDALRLKGANLKNDSIIFTRQKTLHNESVVEIKVPLHEETKKIIDKYSLDINMQDLHIFPILMGITDEATAKARIRSFRNYHNKKLKNIGRKLGLAERPVLATSRHSFATRLKLNGFESVAGEMMGHSRSETTAHYLKSLPISKLQSVTDSLLD